MSYPIESYCPSCDNPFAGMPAIEHATLKVRGEDVSYEALALRCPSCGNSVGDSRIEEENLLAAYAAYRESHDIMDSEEIRSLRQFYGLSVREFGRFLGFGEQTVTKYESGSLPDKLHANALKMAQDAEGASMLLALNRDDLSSRSIEKIVERIAATEGPLASSLDPRDRTRSTPSALNGYRPFSFDRLASLVWNLAIRCQDPYKTKLQKAAFFCDTYACEQLGRSISDSTYAHATYGPVINNYELLLELLEKKGCITLRSEGWGDIIIPLKRPNCELDPEELDIIETISQFADSFDTANELSDFSHQLEAWASTKNGEAICYNKPFGQISEAVEARLS